MSTPWICALPRSSASAGHETRSGSIVYNVTNSGAVLTYNQTFNPATTAGSQAWMAPLSVLTPRFLKIGVQIDF